jgi:hypothetical protein
MIARREPLILSRTNIANILDTLFVLFLCSLDFFIVGFIYLVGVGTGHADSFRIEYLVIFSLFGPLIGITNILLSSVFSHITKKHLLKREAFRLSTFAIKND